MPTHHAHGPRILIVTPEVTFLPYARDKSVQLTSARAGGLADISACLIHSLHDLQMEIHVAIPDYRNVFQKNTLPIHSAARHRRYERLPAARVHLARDRSFFYQPKLSGLPVRENIKISLAFQREVINRIVPEIRPDLIHCFDWMTGLIPAMTRQLGIPCLFTLYNLNTAKVTLAAIEEQGIDAAGFWQHCYFTEMPGSYEETRDSNPVNFLVSAIFSAHFVNTVSKAFPRQLVETEASFMEAPLRQELRYKLDSGCLAAIDHAPGPSFNPAIDRFLFRCFTPKDPLAGKSCNKLSLQEKLHLPMDAGAPLFFWPTRLDSRRAECALVIETLPQLLENLKAHPPQIVFIADGDFQEALRTLVRQHHLADRVAITDFSASLHRLAYAAADFVLTAVEYERCGLPCKIGQRYGALPIAHNTGAIEDVIDHLDCAKNIGNGFLFNDLDTGGLLWAVTQAMAFFQKPTAIRTAQLQRIMTESLHRYDYSRTVMQYVNLYDTMLQLPFSPNVYRMDEDTELEVQTAA